MFCCLGRKKRDNEIEKANTKKRNGRKIHTTKLIIQ
ncbi:unnamed protein product [Paramecium primaurelia]|uniref:Uncharacterized protein n=1 Tax=Paramecium primaurelia TaxID=5886 RepID=A0A8S1M815_PARPR|nr:unnamed protein product [Paramecium primaurelia]